MGRKKDALVGVVGPLGRVLADPIDSRIRGDSRKPRKIPMTGLNYNFSSKIRDGPTECLLACVHLGFALRIVVRAR